MSISTVKKSSGVRRHASIEQLRFERKYRKHDIEANIRILEFRFKGLNYIDNPAEWFDMQDQLGCAYAQLMKLWRQQNNR